MTKRLSTPERIAVTATLALVAVFGTTAAITHTPAPTADTPTVVTLSAEELTETCGHPVTACYRPDRDPNVVYVSDNVVRPDVLAYIIAHETVHFEQRKAHRPFDECEADAIALARTPQYTGHGAYADQCDAGHTTNH